MLFPHICLCEDQFEPQTIYIINWDLNKAYYD